ncbi:MAG: DUF3488 domain-containing protein [Chloroflexi bacterium]|nr:DUF3488 domain-containing protein [Chloroflexota bacterium]
MEHTTQSGVQPRPRIDWAVVILALCTALAPAVAAADATLRLPWWQFFWGGLLGLGPGAVAGRRHPAGWGASRRARVLRAAGMTALWSAGLAVLILSAGQALPSFNLVITDVAAYASWVWSALWRDPAAGLPPRPIAPALWNASLARFRDQLLSAPAAGERGAALMLAVAGIGLTWSGALLTGAAIAARQATLGRGMVALAALGITAILGGGSGGPLIFGATAWLLLAIASGFRCREARWDAAATDYSTELFRDVLAWGTLFTSGALLAAWLLPLWPGNPLARAFIRDDEIPSGLAVLERTIQRPHPSGGTADIGVPAFAELTLGQSLELGPPEQPALRMTVSAPLPAAREPRYWRVRIFNRYTGDGWGSSARVADEPPVPFPDEPLPGTIIQQVDDLRPQREALAALADPLFADVPTRAERLRDGSLLALLPARDVTRYRVVSRIPDQAASAENVQPGAPPPDMGPYLGIPGNLPARIGDLATIIAGEARGDEARALALERYLRNLPYTYQVEPLASGADGVDQFLFSMRSGYCTYYASAMAVMARTLGIPSRVAVGYATGTYDERAGMYLVREADAHAWPELFIAGRWTAFEPTPVRPLPDRGAAPAPAPTSLPASELARDRVTGPLIWLAILAGAVVLIAGGFLLGRRPAPESPVTRAQRDLEACGTRAGLPWPHGATLHEYAALVALRAPALAGDLTELVSLVSEAQYSDHRLDRPAIVRMALASERLRSWRPRQGGS